MVTVRQGSDEAVFVFCEAFGGMRVLGVTGNVTLGRCSSVVERVLGKDEVTGSSPVIGSILQIV